MVAVRKDRICRPDGAEILFWFWFYKYAAPTALGTGALRAHFRLARWDERRAKIVGDDVRSL
jgi:hypothetical protein